MYAIWITPPSVSNAILSSAIRFFLTDREQVNRPHITLLPSFRTKLELDELRKMMDEFVATRKSFKIGLEAFTVFSRGVNKLSVAMNVGYNHNRLVTLHDHLIAHFGATIDANWLPDFTPHLTLAKNRDEEHVKSITNMLHQAQLALRFECTGLVLVELDTSDSHYSPFPRS